MDKKSIYSIFYSHVTPSRPNEWEVDEVLEGFTHLSDDLCRSLLAHIPAVWPVSHSLCFRYLAYGQQQIELITPGRLSEWVRQILFHYETGGLRLAELFMADVEGSFHNQHRLSESRLDEIGLRMTHYIRGVSGRYLHIAEDMSVWTDTETIYLPSSIDFFSTKEENSLVYKFLVTCQWQLIRLGIFSICMGPDDSVENRFGVEAAELRSRYDLSDAVRYRLKLYLFIKSCIYIREHLPGLWARSRQLILFGASPAGDDYRLPGQVRAALDSDGNISEGLYTIPEIDLTECLAFVEQEQSCDGPPVDGLYGYLLGDLRFSRAESVIIKERERNRDAFVDMLARILPEGGSRPDPGLDRESDTVKTDEGSVGIISEALKKIVDHHDAELLTIENVSVTVPEELRALAEKINNDFGEIPVAYIQAASGLAGEGRVSGRINCDETEEPGLTERKTHVYDEWDCRRNGYRRDWCTLIEEELPAAKSTFIANTLQKYSGLRKKLRVQFEMMQTEHRFVGRQPDGDDLDLDAIIDAMGNRMAGTPEDERLFIRLIRDQRDIATLFLVDMSNSTSGWIGSFIKESLVLLCEAMEKIGDQYGIYGFSGMKRSGNKLYHVKHFDEPYDEGTRDRIAAVGPKDYTRMAPAIRHLTSLLGKVDARSRLLIILSDGKPEDYDGYNGDYAIEDTRKALLEARGKGITSFCITIDKQAHDYLDHMFGQGNYIFINKIENLPARMAQVYRVLTR